MELCGCPNSDLGCSRRWSRSPRNHSAHTRMRWAPGSWGLGWCRIPSLVGLIVGICWPRGFFSRHDHLKSSWRSWACRGRYHRCHSFLVVAYSHFGNRLGFPNCGSPLMVLRPWGVRRKAFSSHGLHVRKSSSCCTCTCPPGPRTCKDVFCSCCIAHSSSWELTLLAAAI